MHHMTRLILFLLVFSAAALPAAAQTASTTSGEPPAVPTPAPIPDGLEAFLEGRRLEAAGRLRDAAAAYEQAMQQAPGVTEIRVSLAALLQQVGLSDRVVELLRDQEPMDWYGRRVYAMALANVMIQRPEMAEAALAAIQDAAEERADDPGLQTAQARVLHRLGRVAEAEVIIADLRAARGGGAQLASYHGRLLEELDRLDDAVEVFSTCADVFSGCRDGLVDVSIASGRLAEAGQALLLDTPNDETDTLLRAAALLSDGGRPDEALATVRRVLTQVPDSPRALTLEALILTDVGRLGEAAPKLRRLLRDDSENPDLLLAAAWAQADRGRGDVDAAREFLNRAWEVVNEDASVPVSTRVCLTGARIELLADRPSAAREWLARIAEPGSMGAELLQLLAESFRRTESWTEGVATLLRLQPRLPAPLRPAAVALENEFRLRAGDATGAARLNRIIAEEPLTAVFMALQAYQSLERWQAVAEGAAVAVARFPDEPGLQFTRAAALERSGAIDEAITAFEAILAEDPTNADAANYLGYLWADRNEELHRALELIQMAVEQRPDSAAYLDSLGWVHYRLGNFEQAEHWLRRSIELGGDADGTVLAHLGEVLAALGRDPEAREILRRALDLGPEHPDLVRELLEQLDGADDRP
jgi:tetratricopeptide (TPR) repeat protein